MKCNHCTNEFDEVLNQTGSCPKCGADIEPAALNINFISSSPNSNISQNTSPCTHLTLKTQFGFGPSFLPLLSELGSINFGDHIFSFVLADGKDWIKINYNDISDLKLDGDSTTFKKFGQEFKIVFTNQPTRAKLFFEIFSKFKNRKSDSSINIPPSLSAELKKRFL